MPINYVFDARGFEPRQELPKHPIGRYQFQIQNTELVPTREGDGQNFKVHCRSQAGQITRNYVIVHPNANTVKIAFEQLCALCYAIGVPQIDFNQDGANIRGAWFWGDVREQPNNKDYVELWKVYDQHGNEPGKAPAVAAGAPNPQPGHVPPQSASYPAPGAPPAPVPATFQPPPGAPPAGYAAPAAPGLPPQTFTPPGGAPTAPGGGFQPQQPPAMPNGDPFATAPAAPGGFQPSNPSNWPGNQPGAVPAFAGGQPTR